MNFGLEGKVAIITGGSEGICKASAISMAQECANVVICSRNPETLNSAAEEFRIHCLG